MFLCGDTVFLSKGIEEDKRESELCIVIKILRSDPSIPYRHKGTELLG